MQRLIFICLCNVAIQTSNTFLLSDRVLAFTCLLSLFAARDNLKEAIGCAVCQLKSACVELIRALVSSYVPTKISARRIFAGVDEKVFALRHTAVP